MSFPQVILQNPQMSYFRRRHFHPVYFSTSAVHEKRVLGAVAHINSGKTTTSEAMLFAAGALQRMGNVDVGDTTLDFLPDERERGITINAAAICFSWRGHEIYLVDSPGHLDFTFEVERALKVMDGVIVLLDAVSGVQPQTEKVWRQADSNNLARVAFVNKMDREGADLDATVRSMRRHFSSIPVITQVPLFDEKTGKFCGIFDLLNCFDDRTSDQYASNEWLAAGGHSGLCTVPRQQQAYVDTCVDTLVENLAEVSDDVMSLWLEGIPIPRETVLKALRQACISGKIVPVMCGSSLKGIGVESLMDSVIKYLPSPFERPPVKAFSGDGNEVVVPVSAACPFFAYAFKVTHDKHRGRMVHLRAFSGALREFRQPFLNTTKDRKEMPTKLLRVLADKYVEINEIATGDIFAAVGLKYTGTGDTLVLKNGPESSFLTMSGIATPPAVFSVALEVDSCSQEKELEEALMKLVEEDCSLETKVDTETGETLLSGMGELHLEVAVDRLSRYLKFQIRMSCPRVAYREAITRDGMIKEVYDQTIGMNRFRASLLVEVSKLPEARGSYRNEICIEDEMFTSEAKQAIRDGIEAGLDRGPLLGSPMTNVFVSVTTGLQGNTSACQDAAALRACASKAIKNALQTSHPILLEPVMDVMCIVPDARAGDTISEISHPTRRRGTIEAVDTATNNTELSENKMSVIRAVVPLEGMIGWATKMRSITKGRGDFTTRFSSYRQVDDSEQKRILAEAK